MGGRFQRKIHTDWQGGRKQKSGKTTNIIILVWNNHSLGGTGTALATNESREMECWMGTISAKTVQFYAWLDKSYFSNREIPGKKIVCRFVFEMWAFY